MPIVNRIAEIHSDMMAWRHDLHAHPELAFEERRTAELVATKLEAFGLEVQRGIAQTGVVGTLRGHPGLQAIGLRADMDALPMHELNGFGHASRHDGRMHACGHDGHTAMLLGAAAYLAETRRFAGTVHFIFQPGEEGGAGGQAMIEDGLFERFPVDEVYGLHNMPGVKFGTIAGRVGPIMAATDRIQIRVRGKGGHAAYPHRTIDPVLIASQIMGALQSVVSRNADPVESLVVGISQFHAGTADNVIADEAELTGTMRSFNPALRNQAEHKITALASGIAAAFGGEAEVTIRRGYPPTVNQRLQLEKALAAAATVVGPDRVDANVAPTMASEDFAFMLQAKPGAYLFLGSGQDDRYLHQSNYDFNDELLPIGASFWARLVETVMPAA